jgi:hypothetical protein
MFILGGFLTYSSVMVFGLGGPQPSIGGGLDVVYHSGYFYVMCCECGDNDSYKHQHRNT